jgi:hypothetical protein
VIEKRLSAPDQPVTQALAQLESANASVLGDWI